MSAVRIRTSAGSNMRALQHHGSWKGTMQMSPQHIISAARTLHGHPECAVPTDLRAFSGRHNPKRGQAPQQRQRFVGDAGEPMQSDLRALTIAYGTVIEEG